MSTSQMPMYTWREIWKVAIQDDPPVDHVSPVTASFIYYVLIIGLAYVLHVTTHGIVPNVAKEYVTDFFKTLTFCAFPLGHLLVREYYGGLGYFIASVIVVLITLRVIKGGSGSPLLAFEDLIRGKIKFWKFSVKVLVQILAGIAAYNAGKLVFMLDLHPFHRNIAQQQQCLTDLNVPFWVGFIIETMATIYLTWLEFQPLCKYAIIDDLIKVGNCSLLVVFGVQFTGMYLHPAMASAYSFGCSGTPTPEHLVVYWFGPFIGTYLAYYLHSKFVMWKPTRKNLTSNGKIKNLPLKKTSSDNVTNNNNNNNNNNGKKQKQFFTKQKKKKRE